MCKTEKLAFIDRVFDALSIYCPEMSEEVKYFVASQFAYESAYGTSNRAVKHYNFCGMKRPHVRPTLDTSYDGVFATFDSFEMCVLDYVYWLAWNKFSSVDLFHKDLFEAKLRAKGYCPDQDYIDKINSIFNQLNF